MAIVRKERYDVARIAIDMTRRNSVTPSLDRHSLMALAELLDMAAQAVDRGESQMLDMPVAQVLHNIATAVMTNGAQGLIAR